MIFADFWKLGHPIKAVWQHSYAMLQKSGYALFLVVNILTRCVFKMLLANHIFMNIFLLFIAAETETYGLGLANGLGF